MGQGGDFETNEVFEVAHLGEPCLVVVGALVNLLL